jgi:glycosyltransferase involved in cell wall biosynthesis
MTTCVPFVEPAKKLNAESGPRIAVVMPCYCVARQIERVLQRVGPEVWRIYCVDDGCPEQSGKIAKRAAREDRRIEVIRHASNKGVGAAVVTGYRQAMRVLPLVRQLRCG